MEHSGDIAVGLAEHSAVADIDVAWLPESCVILVRSIYDSTVIGNTDRSNSLELCWDITY